MKDLYDVRFSDRERASRESIWKVLCEQFFQRWVPPSGVVIDLGCGFGEFIRHIKAGRKLAVDLNPMVARYLPDDVELIVASAEDLSVIEPDSIDTCFTSNFLEHLPSKEVMDRVLLQVLRILKPGGALMAMQPNIRYAPGRYWDYYDHVLPLSHLSAREGFEKNGFEIERLIGRFVPFTTKSAYPRHPILVSLYLKMPFIWRFLGKQFLVIARKPQTAAGDSRQELGGGTPPPA